MIVRDISFKEQISKFLFYLVLNLALSYIVLAVYIVPYGTIPIAKIFYPFWDLSLLLCIAIYGRLRIRDIYFILILSLFSVIFYNYSVLTSSSVLISMYLVDKLANSYNVKIKALFILSMIFFSLLGFFIFLKPSAYVGRFYSNVPDPNISGLSLLFVFYLSNKITWSSVIFKKIWSSMILVLGSGFILLTQSRALLIAFVVFYLIKILKRLRVFQLIFSKGNLYIIFALFLTLSIILSICYFIINLNKGDVSRHRLLHIKDSSNDLRFSSNIFFFTQIIENPISLLRGPDNYEEYYRANAGAIIHNSILDLFAKTGLIYATFYFFVLIYLLNKYYTCSNYEYIFSYLTFSLFLFNLFETFWITLFWLVLFLKTKTITIT